MIAGLPLSRTSSATVLLARVGPVAVAPAVQAAWLAALPPARAAALARWPNPRAVALSLVGTRLLALALRRHGYPADALLTLRHAPATGPTLGVPLHFSIAHAGSVVLCAVSPAAPLGVDVEPVGSIVADGFALYLDAAERAWCGASARRFAAVWTAKEAVAKAAASGGLAAVPRVRVAAGARSATLDGVRWRTPALAVGRGHVARLALRDGDARATLEAVPLSCLVDNTPFRRDPT